MKKGPCKGRKEKCLLEQWGDIHAPRKGHTKIIITEERQQQGNMNHLVKNLNHALNGVSASGKGAGKIAASIDEIARQANLLALAAAVEAGRAGKESAGLSAVAGKAISLAIKSAEAVGDIRRHIEDAVATLESLNDSSPLTEASFRENRVTA